MQFVVQWVFLRLNKLKDVGKGISDFIKDKSELIVSPKATPKSK